MMLFFRMIACLSALCFTATAFGWNAVGHRLVAQIAYDHLTPQTKLTLEKYNHALDKTFSSTTLINAAPWLDGLRYMNELWLQPMHYINMPFTRDGSEIIPPSPINAITAIHDNSKTLSDPHSSLYNRGFSLRILIHVVGDLHQPMHAVTEYSARFPQGDLGGNRLRLGKNSVAENLHRYWDNGAGILLIKKRYKIKLLQQKAKRIEVKWPCEDSVSMEPEQWAQESHQLAVSTAYQLTYGQKPSQAYQKEARLIVEQRLALAGCRLATLLNQLVDHS